MKGFLGELLERFRRQQADDYTFVRIDDPARAAPLRIGQQYLRVRLRSARIADVRRWATKFHACVHAQFAFPDLAQGRREVVCVAAPDKTFAELDPAHLDRLVTIDQTLLGPVPYRGDVDCDIALFSVAAADLAKPYLELLAELTRGAGAAIVAQAAPLVEPIRRGAQMLLSQASRSQLEIGVSRSDTALAPGTWIVARVPKADWPAGVRIDPNDHGLVDARGRPLRGFPYLVIGIEAVDFRDDYPSLPAVRDAWDAVLQGARRGAADDEIAALMTQLRRAVALSPDLVPADRRRIVALFQQELADAGYDLGATSPAAPAVPAGTLEAMPATARTRRTTTTARSRTATSTTPVAIAETRGTRGPRGLRDAQQLLTAKALAGALDAAALEALEVDDADADGHFDCDTDGVDPADRPPPASRRRATRAARPWRVAKGLLRLREQVDALAPQRSKASDGSIGDAAHASRASDHNPWVVSGGLGIVTAIDVTHDPAHGCDAARLAEALRTGRDARIKYVIWNRRIFSATVQPWTWRPYPGSNPHDHHVHISIRPEAARFDDVRDWAIDA